MFNLIQAVKLFFLRWNDFSGRSSRSEYWWARLFTCTLVLLSLIPLVAKIPAILENPETAKTLGLTPFAPFILVIILLTIPGLALEVRRFHDRNMSGWFFLLVCLTRRVPIVGFVLAVANFVIFCMPGTNGENTYGPDPLGPDSEGRQQLSQSEAKPSQSPVYDTRKRSRKATPFSPVKTYAASPAKFEPVRWEG